MAENVEGHRGRIGRWLVLAVLVAIGVWVVRSRRAAHTAAHPAWPVDTGTRFQPPQREDAPAAAPTTPSADPAPRRPSPRPRPAVTP